MLTTRPCPGAAPASLRAGDAAGGLYLQFHRQADSGHPAGPIKADLGLSDTQLGACGFAFALLYSTMGLPLAWLADRRRTHPGDRRFAGGVERVYRAVRRMVSGYWAMFACRLGVGVGEAGGVAPSYALISDTFAPQQRARALAIYSLGIPAGLGSGHPAGRLCRGGGELARRSGGGLAGLAFTPLFAWTVRDRRPAWAKRRPCARCWRSWPPSAASGCSRSARPRAR
jgi:MFS family permease